jgi:hypothetical protein
VDLLEVGKEPFDVVERVRPLGVPGQLHPLPGGMRLCLRLRRRLFRSLFGLHSLNLNSGGGLTPRRRIYIPAAVGLLTVRRLHRKALNCP